MSSNQWVIVLKFELEHIAADDTTGSTGATSTTFRASYDAGIKNIRVKTANSTYMKTGSLCPATLDLEDG